MWLFITTLHCTASQYKRIGLVQSTVRQQRASGEGRVVEVGKHTLPTYLTRPPLHVLYCTQHVSHYRTSQTSHHKQHTRQPTATYTTTTNPPSALSTPLFTPRRWHGRFWHKPCARSWSGWPSRPGRTQPHSRTNSILLTPAAHHSPLPPSLHPVLLTPTPHPLPSPPANSSRMALKVELGLIALSTLSGSGR